MTLDNPTAARNGDSPALMTVTFRVHRFEPFDAHSAAPGMPANPPAGDSPQEARQGADARNATAHSTDVPSDIAPGARGRHRHSSPFARIDAQREREAMHNANSASAASTEPRAASTAPSAASTPSTPRAVSRPARRPHTSPFARIDAQREREAQAAPRDTARADTERSRHAAIPRDHRHSSPFARIDAKRSAGASDASHTSASAPASRAHRPMRSTRRAASTLGGAPVAGGFGADDSGRSWTQDYTLTVNPRTTVLDCLLLIKRTQDPTLAFRYSCGHGMCGSDAVAVNGTPSLLCKTTVEQAAASARPTSPGFRRTAGATQASATPSPQATPSEASVPVIDLAPIAAFSVQRDLIADIDPMLDQIRALQPYLQARGDLAMTADGKINVFEYLQSPEQLAKFEQLTTCIACGVCEASCPVFVGGDAFVGPAALVNQIRFIDDSRDGAAARRLEAISDTDGLPACQSVRACGLNCPQGIDVGEVIWQFIQGVQTRKQEG